MSTIDLEALLLEVEPGAPCGPDLEYDPAFLALEREAVGKPEVQYGATITPAVPPDWKAVRRMAGELLGRSRDLRLALHLLRAELALDGIAGLADGLVLIERLLAERWDSVHPMLDSDDGNDPTLRINSLAILADAGTLVRELKETSLLVLPGLGPLSIRLLEIANGEAAAGDEAERIAPASIERAIADLAPGALQAALATLGRALDAAVNIEVGLVRQVGSAQALNLDPLVRPLRKAHEFLARQQGAAAPATVAQEAAPAAAGSAPVAGARGGNGTDIATREDVLRTLERLVQYYRQHEPSSPVPILLERARRLVPMTFFEILQDLAPDGVAQMAVIRGPELARQDSET
ncbi:type VI secretion system protein TssA [Massilia sp. MS-15]|uniref:type VI secretion system protein TssA n=1 Tax=Massilia sp. MS-15 TaxID=2878200 RepID=UPI001CD46ECB|nr:type VI secretion system protein TssA [Massilia sp. MS-15]MCA1245707.1 type VI secretion system protein TssA [Massilia sp. MS-15]